MTDDGMRPVFISGEVLSLTDLVAQKPEQSTVSHIYLSLIVKYIESRHVREKYDESLFIHQFDRQHAHAGR